MSSFAKIMAAYNPTIKYDGFEPKQNHPHPPTVVRDHHHPFSPNTAWGMGWPEPCTSQASFGQEDNPIIPGLRTWPKKSIPCFNDN